MYLLLGTNPYRSYFVFHAMEITRQSLNVHFLYDSEKRGVESHRARIRRVPLMRTFDGSPFFGKSFIDDRRVSQESWKETFNFESPKTKIIARLFH